MFFTILFLKFSYICEIKFKSFTFFFFAVLPYIRIISKHASYHLSGFTGSCGFAIVTSKAAFLWTDPRYFLQASDEISEQWVLMRMGDPDVPKLTDWVALPHEDLLPKGAKVGETNKHIITQ